MNYIHVQGTLTFHNESGPSTNMAWAPEYFWARCRHSVPYSKSYSVHCKDKHVLVYCWQIINTSLTCLAETSKKKPLPGCVYHLSASVQNFGHEKLKIIWVLMASARAQLTTCKGSSFLLQVNVTRVKLTTANC